ncbi:T-cell surface glycoprotein CD3 delta chain isoform X2 [Castor canadensis]|uniref:T-cell surface glycoprotein CD3 delta chain n=1 Tax=Castor canadensis TaxID=51338 RepID=A0A8B7WAZ0_CASCN
MSQLAEGGSPLADSSVTWHCLLDEFCWKMEHSRILAGLMLVAFLPQASLFKITVAEHEDKVFLSCNTSITWLEGTVGTQLIHNKNLDLGKRILDPRGTYTCNGTEELAKEVSTLQVYFRMADTQDLLRNEQLYQPLQDHDDSQYSRLGGNWPQKK